MSTTHIEHDTHFAIDTPKTRIRRDTKVTPEVDVICRGLRASARAYAQLVRAQTRLTNQIKANMRATGALPNKYDNWQPPIAEVALALDETNAHIAECRDAMESKRKMRAKEIEKLAKMLPIE